MCSVSSLMTTTEAIVVELPKPASEGAPGMGGGMGGMGGMDFWPVKGYWHTFYWQNKTQTLEEGKEGIGVIKMQEK